MVHSFATSFQVFLSVYISLPFGTSLTFLLSLLSAVLISVAFRHLATKSSFYFARFSIILLFFRAVAIAVLLLFFSLGCRAVLRFSLPFKIPASIYIPTPFSSLPSVLLLFSQQLSRLFIQGWTFRLLSCRFSSGAVAIFEVAAPLFFSFLLFWLSFFSSFSRHHAVPIVTCSTGSNSHTVVLSKLASYSPALFSIPVKICEHAYQSFIV